MVSDIVFVHRCEVFAHYLLSTGDGICILQAVLMDNLIEACVILKRSSGVTKTPGK